MESIVQQPFQAADWRGQILELVDRRAAGFEKMKPFLLAGLVHRHRSAFLKAAHARFVGLLRDILVAVLPRDIARDTILVEALDMLLGFESWNRLREDQGLGVAKSKRVLKQAIESLLDGQAGQDTRRAEAP